MDKRAKEGRRYRVIHDSDEDFADGEIVVSLENSNVPFCVRERDYVEGKGIFEYDKGKVDVLSHEELEELESEDK